MLNDIKPSWHRPGPGGSFLCELCFHKCLITAGNNGFCNARGVSMNGIFVSPHLGRFSSAAIDPIEKKPLKNWRPGSYIFSTGSLGCNMHCRHCQNHQISQPQRQIAASSMTPEMLRDKILSYSLNSVAYTYNEPMLQAEYIVSAGPVMREAGIATVMVTNGITSQAVLEELAPQIDAVNVDIKSFNADVYKNLGGSLSVVKNTVYFLLKKGVHVEITNLVVPGISDDRESFVSMLEWISSMSSDIPLHITRYFPAFKSTAPATDMNLLLSFQSLARQSLKNVYLGNVE